MSDTNEAIPAFRVLSFFHREKLLSTHWIPSFKTTGYVGYHSLSIVFLRLFIMFTVPKWGVIYKDETISGWKFVWLRFVMNSKAVILARLYGFFLWLHKRTNWIVSEFDQEPGYFFQFLGFSDKQNRFWFCIIGQGSQKVGVEYFLYIADNKVLTYDQFEAEELGLGPIKFEIRKKPQYDLEVE